MLNLKKTVFRATCIVKNRLKLLLSIDQITQVAGQLRTAMDDIKVQKQQDLILSLNHR